MLVLNYKESMRLLKSKLLLATQLVAAEEGCKLLSITITTPNIEHYSRPKCDFNENGAYGAVYECDPDTNFDLFEKRFFHDNVGVFFEWTLSNAEQALLKKPENYQWYSDYSDLGTFYYRKPRWGTMKMPSDIQI